MAGLRLLTILLTWGFAAQGFAQSVHGVLMVVKGDVEVLSVKTKTIQKAKVGDKVFPGDTISAGKDARAKVVMTDKNILNISPDTKIEIAKYEFKPQEDKKNVLLNVVYGKVRATVSQKYDGDKSQFNVKTPSAVAGVRGTDFITQHSPVTNTSKVVTFSGRVDVGSGFGADGKIVNPVSVSPGQFTVATNQAPPAPPVKLSPGELQQMNKETAVQETPKSENRNPSSSESSQKSDKSDKPSSSNKSNDDPKNANTGKNDGPKNAGSKDETQRGPASVANSPAMMAPSDADLTAASPAGPVAIKRDTAMPMDPVCATCGILDQRPPVIPGDLIINQKTQVTITIGR